MGNVITLDNRRAAAARPAPTGEELIARDAFHSGLELGAELQRRAAAGPVTWMEPRLSDEAKTMVRRISSSEGERLIGHLFALIVAGVSAWIAVGVLHL